MNYQESVEWQKNWKQPEPLDNCDCKVCEDKKAIKFETKQIKEIISEEAGKRYKELANDKEIQK